MYSLEEFNKKGLGVFKHKKFEVNDKREKVLTNLFEGSQVGINLVIAISNSGKTTYIHNMIEAIIEPFKKKKDNPLYNKLKEKEIFFFFITTSRGTDKKITQIIDDVENLKHPITSVKIYEKFEDEEYNELREILEATEKDDEYDYPQNIIIFDDARAYLRNNKNLEELATRFRHTQTLCIISTHEFKDTTKKVRDNSFYITLFNNISNDRLREIHDTFLSSISFEDFLNIYHETLNKKGDFLFIDRENQKINKNNMYSIILNK